MGRTYHQLLRLSDSINKRVSDERVIQTNMVRAATQSQREEFERFLESLKGSGGEEDSPQVSTGLPEGLAYTG